MFVFSEADSPLARQMVQAAHETFSAVKPLRKQRDFNELEFIVSENLRKLLA